MKEKKDEMVIKGSELSYETKMIVTVICLVTVYPIGVVLMFAWMRWSKRVKALIFLPLILGLFIPLLVLLAVLTMMFRVSDNVSRPETIREFREIFEVTPTEEVRLSPTISPMVTKAVKK